MKHKYLLFFTLFPLVIFSGCFKKRKKSHFDLSKKENHLLDNLDPDKPLTIIIHGTRLPAPFLLIPGLAQQVISPAGIHHAREVSSLYSSKRLASSLSYYSPDLFPEKSIYLYGWSGELSVSARKKYAYHVYSFIKRVRDDVRYKDTPITVITMSHGGNVALNIAKVAEEHNDKRLLVNKLILLGNPIQEFTEHYARSPVFGKIYNLYSRGDSIQRADPQGLQGATQFFSNRRLDDQPHIFNIEICRGRMTLSHIEFVFQDFLKHLSTIINTCEERAQNEKYLRFDLRKDSFVTSKYQNKTEDLVNK